MGTCACGAPAEFFSTAGEPQCRAHFHQAQAAAQQARVYVDPGVRRMENWSRGKLMAAGAAAIGFAVLVGVVETVFAGRVHVFYIGIVALGGIGLLAKASRLPR